MSQPDSQPPPSNAIFNGPTFHVSGMQIVPEVGEVSLYMMTTRHVFSAAGSQVRAMNEIVARLTMSAAAAERMAEALRGYVDQQKRSGSSS